LTTIAVQDAAARYKVVLLSPRARRRNALLADLIGAPDSYYYALSPSCHSIASFLEGLVEALREESPKFGQQIEQALSSRKPKVADMAQAMAADLTGLKPSLSLLILSELDYLPFDEDVSAFFVHLLKALPQDIKLVINARELPLDPWASLVRAGGAVVLGAPEGEDNIFDPAWPHMPHLEVVALGLGKAYVNGKPVQIREGPLTRNLFFYFIDHPSATRSEIYDTFWPGFGNKEATNVFHVTKRKITEFVGRDITRYVSAELAYKHAKDVLFHYDVGHFETAMREARTSDSLQSWRHALRLYCHPFLSGSEMPWIVERREQLRQDYAEALIAAARLHKAEGETDRAILFDLRALNELPEREDVYRDLMTLYAQSGQTDKAVAQFRLLERLLRKRYNISPAKATLELYAKLSGGSGEIAPIARY